MKADTDKCIACKRCFPYCPMGKIQTFHRHESIPGRVYIEIDQEKCTDCGMCLRAAICPVNALYQPEKPGTEEKTLQPPHMPTSYLFSFQIRINRMNRFLFIKVTEATVTSCRAQSGIQPLWMQA